MMERYQAGYLNKGLTDACVSAKIVCLSVCLSVE